METRSAIIAGSFDPVTFGHLWVLDQALRMFDTVHVLVCTNAAKKNLFSADERVSLFKACIPTHENVIVSLLPDRAMLASYAAGLGCSHVVRGIRNSTDFEYESQLNLINTVISPELQTIFIMPRRDLIEVSSSMIRGLVQLDGGYDIAKKYVPLVVLEALKR
jgi:pantetheine-phosphate adenylyltransferase